MYIPSNFAVDDDATIRDHLREHPFATLITGGSGELVASHVPLLLGESDGVRFLEGHLARPNDQGEADGQPALAIFHGPHAYISARWYQSAGTVPTWNYTTVHVYGQLVRVDDTPTLLDSLERLARFLEPEAAGWRFDHRDPALQLMLRGIVGFRLVIERWEAKFKLSQNHPVSRRQRVVEELEARGEPADHQIARLMRRTLPPIGNDVPTTAG